MMRMPVYLVCAALILAVKSEDESNYYGNQLEPMMDVLPEDEPIRFLFPRLAKMRPNRNNWIDDQYYNVPDVQSNSIEQISLSSEGRFKRTEGMGGRLMRPSLSFSNSLDVLRDRLILEATRKQSQKDMTRNRARLCQIGKRSQMDQSGCNDLKSSRVFLN